jgi:phosphoribosylaminoimidazolecarboxamide formyltransferase/IMP cyclohydrolase
VNFVETIDDAVPLRHALISVYDKRGLDRLVPALVRINPKLRLFSTGGSYSVIRELLGREAARNLTQVSDYTGQPEMQGGLVKTLDFKIYLGLLAETYNTSHAADLSRTGAVPIDLVVVNLYPFAETVARLEAGPNSPNGPEQARANIDIGGPCLARAAAKNFLRVAAVVDPADYGPLVAELENGGGRIGLATRFRLAQKAFAYTAGYDRAVAEYLGGCSYDRVAASYPRIHPGVKT